MGSLWRAVFEVEFAAAIARLLELTDPTDVAVTGITRGSVVVDFTVAVPPDDHGDMQQAMRHLETNPDKLVDGAEPITVGEMPLQEIKVRGPPPLAAAAAEACWPGDLPGKMQVGCVGGLSIVFVVFLVLGLGRPGAVTRP